MSVWPSHEFQFIYILGHPGWLRCPSDPARAGGNVLSLSEDCFSRAAPVRLLQFRVSFSRTQSTQSPCFFSMEGQARRSPLVLGADMRRHLVVFSCLHVLDKLFSLSKLQFPFYKIELRRATISWNSWALRSKTHDLVWTEWNLCPWAGQWGHTHYCGWIFKVELLTFRGYFPTHISLFTNAFDFWATPYYRGQALASPLYGEGSQGWGGSEGQMEGSCETRA